MPAASWLLSHICTLTLSTKFITIAFNTTIVVHLIQAVMTTSWPQIAWSSEPFVLVHVEVWLNQTKSFMRADHARWPPNCKNQLPTAIWHLKHWNQEVKSFRTIKWSSMPFTNQNSWSCHKHFNKWHISNYPLLVTGHKECDYIIRKHTKHSGGRWHVVFQYVLKQFDCST